LLDISLPDAIPKEFAPPDYPTLRHLTLPPGTREVSNFRIQAPNLTSLRILLDSRFSEEMCEALMQDASIPGFCPSLRSYTICGYNDMRRDEIFSGLLMTLLAPIFKRGSSLPIVKLQDIVACDDDNYTCMEFEGTGRIALLALENVFLSQI
jgi:hypothetical protein